MIAFCKLSYLLFYRILSILEAGLVKRWQTEFFPSLACDTGTKAEAHQTTTEDVLGAFLLLVLGMVAALFTIVFEIFLSNTKRKLIIEN